MPSMAGDPEAGRLVVGAAGDEAGLPAESTIPRLLLAPTPWADPDAARAAYGRHRERLPFRVRIHTEHLMWRMTGLEPHLREAWRRLGHLRDHAPEGYRESLMRDQPMRREIAEDRAAREDRPAPSS